MSRLPWEINWLLAHGWSSDQIAGLADTDLTPVAYLTGEAPFGDLTVKVDKNVLIPRLETEKMVNLAIECPKNGLMTDKMTEKSKKSEKAVLEPFSVVEVGTGCGAMALAIAHTWQRRRLAGRVLALDCAAAALDVARVNIRRHRLDDRVQLRESDLLEVLQNDQTLTLATAWTLVANLPYIPSTAVKRLDPSVRDFEPHLALDGGEDGFQLIGRLLEQVERLAHPPARIILEIDPRHPALFPTDGNYDWRFERDFNGLWRYGVGNRNL
jgi:release factor glutamine methyltransferase